jgi:hypothetical protein
MFYGTWSDSIVGKSVALETDINATLAPGQVYINVSTEILTISNGTRVFTLHPGWAVDGTGVVYDGVNGVIVGNYATDVSGYVCRKFFGNVMIAGVNIGLDLFECLESVYGSGSISNVDLAGIVCESTRIYTLSSLRSKRRSRTEIAGQILSSAWSFPRIGSFDSEGILVLPAMGLIPGWPHMLSLDNTLFNFIQFAVRGGFPRIQGPRVLFSSDRHLEMMEYSLIIDGISVKPTVMVSDASLLKNVGDYAFGNGLGSVSGTFSYVTLVVANGASPHIIDSERLFGPLISECVRYAIAASMRIHDSSFLTKVMRAISNVFGTYYTARGTNGMNDVATACMTLINIVLDIGVLVPSVTPATSATAFVYDGTSSVELLYVRGIHVLLSKMLKWIEPALYSDTKTGTIGYAMILTAIYTLTSPTPWLMTKLVAWFDLGINWNGNTTVGGIIEPIGIPDNMPAMIWLLTAIADGMISGGPVGLGNNLTIAEMQSMGYSSQTIMNAGFSLSELLEGGFTMPQLAANGNFPIKYNAFTPAYVIAQTVSAGFSASDLYHAGYPSFFLRANGYSIADVIWAGYGINDIALAGFEISVLRNAGFTLGDVFPVYRGTANVPVYSIAACKNAGYDARDAYNAGLSVSVAYSVFTVSEMRIGGYTLSEMIAGGLQIRTLALGGYSASMMKQVNVSVALMYQYFNATQMRLANYDVAELIPYTVAQLKAGGYDIYQVQKGGRNLAEIIGPGGWNLSDVHIANNSVGTGWTQQTGRDFVAIGINVGDAFNAHFSLETLYDDGLAYSCQELSRYFTFTQISMVTKTVTELHSAGYTVSQLRNIGFKPAALIPIYGVTDVCNGGYEVDILAAAGILPRTIANSGAGYAIAAIVAAGTLLDQPMLAYYLADMLPPTFTKNYVLAARYPASALHANGSPKYTVSDLSGANYTVAELLGIYPSQDVISTTSGFNAEDYLNAKVSIEDLKDAGFKPAILGPLGKYVPWLRGTYPDLVIITAGFGCADLKNAGFLPTQLKLYYSASQMYAAGFSVPVMVAADYNLMELKEAGFLPIDLKGSFTDQQIVGVGFQGEDLTNAGIDAETMAKMGNYTAAQLLALHFSQDEIASAGFTVGQLYSAGVGASSLKSAGFNCVQLIGIGGTSGPYSILNIVDSTYGLGGLFSASVTPATICAAVGMFMYTASDFKRVGYGAGALRLANYTATRLRHASFSISDLIEGQYTNTDIANAGFTARDLWNSSIDASALLLANYKISEMHKAGYTLRQMSNVPTSTKTYVETQFLNSLSPTSGHGSGPAGGNGSGHRKVTFLRILWIKGYSPSEFLNAGIGAVGMRRSGFSVREVVKCNFTDYDIILAGFSLKELISAGITAKSCFNNGIHASDARKIYSDSDVINAGYTVLELGRAGFSAGQLHNAGISLIAMLQSGMYNIASFHNANISASILYSSLQGSVSFSIAEAMDFGYTPFDLFHGGVPLSLILNANPPITSLSALVPHDISLEVLVKQYDLQNIVQTYKFNVSEILPVVNGDIELIAGLNSRNGGSFFTCGDFHSAEPPVSAKYIYMRRPSFNIHACMEGGYSVSELLEAGAKIADFYFADPRINVSVLIAGGLTETQILSSIPRSYGVEDFEALGESPVSILVNLGIVELGQIIIQVALDGNVTTHKPYTMSNLVSAKFGAVDVYHVLSATFNNDIQYILGPEGYNSSGDGTSGYSLNALLEAHVEASFFKSINSITVTDMAANLLNHNYTVGELFDANYPASTLITSTSYGTANLTDILRSYSLSDVVNAYVKVEGMRGLVSRLRNAQVKLSELTGLMNGGTHVFSVTDFIGIYPETEILDPSSGFSISAMATIYTATQLRIANWPLSTVLTCVIVNGTVNTSGTGNITLPNILSAGFSATDVYNLIYLPGYGAQPSSLSQYYTAQELCSAGYSVSSLMGIYTTPEIVQAGYSIYELNGYSDDPTGGPNGDGYAVHFNVCDIFYNCAGKFLVEDFVGLPASTPGLTDAMTASPNGNVQYGPNVCYFSIWFMYEYGKVQQGAFDAEGYGPIADGYDY